MATTFTDEQVEQAVRSEAAAGYVDELMIGLGEPDDETIAGLAEALAEGLDGGDPVYRIYIADQVAADLDVQEVLDVLVNPERYTLTGRDGVVANIVAAFQELNLMDASDWATECKALARDAEVQDKIDTARGK